MRGWVSVAFLFGGCSYLFVTSPPENAAELPYPPECSTSQAAPVLDTLGATYQVVRVGLAVNASDEAYRDAPISREADIGFGIGLTVLHLASAVYGHSATAACRQAKDEWSERQMSRPQKRDRSVPVALCTTDASCPPGFRCITVGERRFCSRLAQPEPAAASTPPAETPGGVLPTEEIECTTDVDCPRDHLCVQLRNKNVCRKPSAP